MSEEFWNSFIYGGALAGYLSLILELLRTLFARPNLKFRVEKTIHYYNKKSRLFDIIAKIHVDNTGERSTTINRIELLNISDEELLDKFNPESSREHFIKPHSSMHIDWRRSISNTDELDYDDIKIKLKIHWTHCHKTLVFITKPRS